MLNKEIIFPIYSKILGKYLKEEMKKKGLSQYDISFAYSKACSKAPCAIPNA